MYIPPKLKCDDREKLLQFVDDYSFGILTNNIEGKPFASHLPMMVKQDKIVGHMARANPQWRTLKIDPNCFCIFSGPHAYISPDWYVNEPSVPTWNYAAVHIYGKAEIKTEADYIDSLLAELVLKSEKENGTNWKYQVDQEYKSRLIANVAAFEISIESIEGKFKFNQTSRPEDLKGAIDGLKSKNDDMSLDVAKWMEICNSDRLPSKP